MINASINMEPMTPAQMATKAQANKDKIFANTAQTLVKSLTTPTKIVQSPQQEKLGIYEPAGIVISSSSDQRIAILGAPGTGKTTSILTFPNRTWLDFDHKLPKGEKTIEFWNPDWVDSYVKRDYTEIPNQRDAYKKWIRENIHKFSKDQTVITDSGTFLENAFDVMTYADDDGTNKYWFWGEKLRYYKELFNSMKGAKCRIVFTFHEAPDRDEKGDLNGKVRPLMDGSFKDQLLGHFTDVWRQRANIYEKQLNGAPKRDANGQKIIKSVNHNGNPNWVWFWQLLGDAEFDTNCNPVLGKKVRETNSYLIPADFAEIEKLYNS